jgi:hypothetical protein
MKNYILLILIFLFSCSHDRKTTEKIEETVHQSETENFVIDSVVSKSDESELNNQAKKEQSQITYSDCIFDNDYKGLTSKWLEELSISNYIWKDELNGALIPSEKDTIFISKGGCDHFDYLVELRIYDNNDSSSDSLTIISKASEIADRYRMNHYSKMIKEGQLKRIENESSIWYEIPDDNMNDNIFYNGIEYKFDGLTKVISISKYIN